MIKFVSGTLTAKNCGADDYVRWLELRHANGTMLTGICDYQGLSRLLTIGKSYELALELTYPSTSGDTGPCWTGTVADLCWPLNSNPIAREPLPKDYQQHVRRRPTGPLGILLQTPFGYMLTSMSQIAHYMRDAPHVGSIITCPYGQRLDLIAVLG